MRHIKRLCRIARNMACSVLGAGGDLLQGNLTWVGTSRRASAAYRSLASTIAASSRRSADSAPPKPYVGCLTSSLVCVQQGREPC